MAADLQGQLTETIGKSLAKAGINVADKAFNFIPSWGEIGSAIGIESGALGGVGTALGGFGAAAGAAAPMLIFATIMSILNKKNHDPSFELAGGTSNNLGALNVQREARPGDAQGLHDLYDMFLGDGKWYEGGDPTKVGDMSSSYGLQKVKAGLPYYSVGTNQPYALPELAASSGRQMARGRMDLSVEHEALPSARNAAGDALFSQYLGNASLPVLDSTQALPSNWDEKQDQARNSRYFAQDNTEASQAFAPSYIEEFTSGLDPRLAQFFDAGLTTDMMYSYTGKNSLDYQNFDRSVAETDNTETETEAPKQYSGISFGDDDMNKGSKSPLATALAHKYNNTDTIPALINPNEADILKGLGGSGHVDPATGMYVFENTEAGDDIWAAAFNASGGGGGFAAPVPSPAASPTNAYDSDAGRQTETRPEEPTRERAYGGPEIGDVSQFIGSNGTGWTDADYAKRASDWDSGGDSNPSPVPARDNSATNKQLTEELGYDGEYGSGGFNDWIQQQPYATQREAADIFAKAGTPERIDAKTWGKGFMNEEPYVDGTVPPSFVDYPDNPPTGAGQVNIGTGYNWLGKSTGQQQLVDYLSERRAGNTPDATKFDPETNQSYALYDGVAEPIDKTHELLAGLPPEIFDALAKSIGYDPNGRDTWLALENLFGLRTMDYGDLTRDAQGNYGWSNAAGSERLAPIESGFIRLGSGPNTIEVDLDDLVSGKYNLNAIELALSGGYDPNGMEGSTNTLDAAREFMTAMPDINNVRYGSAEFNTLRKPVEAATPGFYQQVGNRIARQQADGRSVPGTPSGAAGGSSPPAGIANGTLDFSNNSAGYDRGSQLISMEPVTGFTIWKHPDGSFYTSSANGEIKLEPAGNGLYWDTQYGELRNSQGVFVNPDGSPIVTPYSEKYYSASGTSDPWRLWGSDGAKRKLGSLAGIDQTLMRDGNNTPIAGQYAGKGPKANGAGGGGGSSGGYVPLPSPGGGGGGGGGGNNGGGNNGGGNSGGNAGNPQNALDKLLAAFPGGYETTVLSDMLDDPIIQRILSEGRATASTALQRARASGQLDDAGYNAAYGDLTGSSSSVAQSRLEELSRELLGGYRQDIRDIIADAADFASVSPKNFSVDPYKQSIDSIVSGVNSNLYGELLRALGGPVFDTASLINTGGAAQGPITSGPSGAGVF